MSAAELKPNAAPSPEPGEPPNKANVENIAEEPVHVKNTVMPSCSYFVITE